MRCRNFCVFSFVFVVIQSVIAAPSVVYGPDQRAKLHQLAHGVGSDIDKEDEQAKKEEAKELKKGISQPPDHEVLMHGLGMHGDMKKTERHKEKDEPRKGRQNQGPCVGMDCLHGVLMHNDEEQGHDHRKEDAEKRKDNRAKGKPSSVADPHEMIHGHRRSIAETAAAVEKNGKKKDKKTKEKPVKSGKKKTVQMPEPKSYWTKFKDAFSSLFVREQEEADGGDMNMMHDLEGIGMVGELKHAHGHDKDNKRLKREEHKSKAHLEH